MRNLLYQNQDKIKFVYNFHAFGPMYIWPYNGQLNNELAQTNPDAQKIFNEIWDNGKFPASTLKGNAIKTVGYTADGEANDWITKTFNIPSVSPELGNDNLLSADFFLPFKFVAREVLRDNHPWIKHTIDKLTGELTIPTKADSVEKLANGNYLVSFTVQNTGLSDWNLADEKIPFFVDRVAHNDYRTLGMYELPNLKARETKQISIELKHDDIWDQNGNSAVSISSRFHPAGEVTEKRLTIEKPQTKSTPFVLTFLL